MNGNDEPQFKARPGQQTRPNQIRGRTETQLGIPVCPRQDTMTALARPHAIVIMGIWLLGRPDSHDHEPAEVRTWCR
jgi:hypothetical protein